MEFDQARYDPNSDYGYGGYMRGGRGSRRCFGVSYTDSEAESDSEMDSSNDGWETDYKAIVRKFTKKGYGEAVPEIVFWNLRHSRSTPVTGSEKGVALVSGYSKNLMKMFLDNDETISPVKIMEAAISGEEYQKLVVIENDNKPRRVKKVIPPPPTKVITYPTYGISWPSLVKQSNLRTVTPNPKPLKNRFDVFMDLDE